MLRSVVKGLLAAPGTDCFVDSHFWDMDPLAIDWAGRDDLRVLVYLAVRPGVDTVYYECEVPVDETDQVYEVTARNENSDPQELLAVVRLHLAAKAP